MRSSIAIPIIKYLVKCPLLVFVVDGKGCKRHRIEGNLFYGEED